MRPDSTCLRIMKRAVYRAVHAWRPSHIVESRCSGVRLRYSSKNQIGEEIFANAFERLERQLLDRIVTPGMTVVDIGANLGLYTCLFAQRVGSSGRVIAFEPTPTTYAALKQNVILNGYDGVVECRGCALSDVKGTARLNMFPEGGDVYNSFGATCAMDGRRPMEAREVQTATLDDSLRHTDLRNGLFIKIDVEGFEQQVIRGGANILKATRRVAMMVELFEPLARQCGCSPLDTVALLESIGFEAYRMTTSAGLARFDAEARQQLAAGRLPPDVFFFKPEMRPEWIK